MFQMADGLPQPGPVETRLNEVTAYRPTDRERRLVVDLLEMAQRPFDAAGATGDDPAIHFPPFARSGKTIPSDPAG